MSGVMRTIRVGGLPLDVCENRLMDKLQIHFLRKKNGGGEISAVSVSRTRPGTAFVTFEESDVAVRLAQKGKQVFKVADKSHVITISLHTEEVNEADEVLLSTSVAVDHRKLPGGEDALFALHRSFPGVDLSYDVQKELYTVRGRYSPVQTLCCMILGTLDKQEQRSADKPQPMTVSTTTYNSLLPPVESPSRPVGASKVTGVEKHTSPSESDLNTEEKSWRTGLTLAGSSTNHTPHVAENKPDSDVESLFENFSLIVDSDIFRYLHHYCSKEYHSILEQHRVEVLDVNCDDITTLYLKPKAALSPHDMSSVIKAHEDLVELYQQKQSQLRKEHVLKPGIPEKDLAHALKSLRRKLPKLMVHEDNMSVYMIGSISDVSEAKQFISDVQEFDMEKETRSEHPFTPSHSKPTFSKQETASSQDPFLPKKDLQDSNQTWMTTEKTFRKNGQNPQKLKTVDETMKKTTEDVFDYRSPVPKDSEWMDTGDWINKNKYTDSHLDSSKTCASHSVMEINQRLFPKSHSVSGKTTNKSKQTETGKDRRMAASFSREMYTGTNDSKSDNVSERKPLDNEQLHSLPVIKPSFNSNLNLSALRGGGAASAQTSKMDIQEEKDNKMLYKKISTSASSSGDKESKGFPTVPSESTLRRSNSFSGRTEKAEEPTQTAVDESAGQKGTAQNSHRMEIVSRNVALPFRLWLYLTSVYKAQIENLMLELQVKESLDKENIVLCLKGLDSDKVLDCYCGLNSLIATTEIDFDARTLPLSKLGVSDSKDRILIELCMLLKQRFTLVKILVMSKDVMILGPKALCDSVEDTMIRVFQERVDNKPAKPHTDVSAKHPPKISDQSGGQSFKKTSEVLTNHAEESRGQDEPGGRRNTKKEEKYINDPTLLQSDGGPTDRHQTDITKTVSEQNTPDISINQIRVSQGTRESSDPKKKHSTVNRAAGGFTGSPGCEDLHNNCRPAESAGIKGTMTVQESTMTIPGFHRDTSLRIIYDIPDGTQADHHPCPGAPFKGSRFEAFLPHNKTTAKILPLLETAFYKGLTFTVRVGPPDNGGGPEGRVVWGSIPHKTKTGGGASGNGFPDSNYIKRLEEALQAAGVGD